MDKNELKEFIKQVAEIEELTPKKDPGIRLDDNAEDIVRVGDEWIELTAKSNPTLGYKFIKLKEQHKLCELGCGDVVPNQKIEKRLCHHPVRHWRTKCSACGCFVSPDGEGFIKGSHAIQGAYLKYFNNVKTVVEKPKSNDSHSEVTDYGKDRPSKWVKDADGKISLKGS